jgi:hypothetical protein
MKNSEGEDERRGTSLFEIPCSRFDIHGDPKTGINTYEI